MEVSCSFYHNWFDLDLDSFFLCFRMVCLNGLYMLCMLFIVSNVLLLVHYLHFISCRNLLPLYVVSSTICPREFFL